MQSTSYENFHIV